ncbi:surfeit locus protein [Lunasporangiospora selenospora]|uniref:Surfeit locus protein n=1 Tax=Lunasporangiospora selenospora TaxID=979761 RepID=A0A9P6KHT3_9FUNG|nr:surfeit locus protein [Lunasporangiospora selenospora]
MSTSFMLDGVEERIKQHAGSFDSLLKLIPAKYYITKELTEEEQNSKYQHNKKRLAPKQEIKEQSRKAKRAKLDPENHKSVSEIQAEMATKGSDDESEEEDNDVAMTQANGADDDEEDEDSDEDETVQEDDSVAATMAKSTKHNFEDLLAKVQDVAKTPAEGPKSITELRVKLEERLAKLRGRRGANAEASGPKPTSRQAILEARMKRKKDKKATIKAAKEKRAAGATSEGLVVKDTETSATGGRPSASSINDKGEVRFSKFEFDGLSKKKRGPTDAQGQLKMVTAHNEKMAALKVADPEKANALKEKDTWKKALQLAQGEKVKDDVKLLKKTIKREEEVKKRSAKDWGERKSTIKKTQDQKQKKREENLKSRIDAKKNKGKKDNKDKGGKKGGAKGGAKGGKKGGKPKARAGFEGTNGKKSKPSKK